MDKSIIKVIQHHQHFLISTHVNPDADAIGSALAVALVLKSLGKKVYVFTEDPVPDWLKFLPHTKLIKQPAQIRRFNYDCAIAVDCGDLSRIGQVRSLLQPGKPIINIDHHKTNDRFGDWNLVVPEASSTAEVLYLLFKKMKAVISRDTAVLLYAGIMTDTGSFRYDCTSSLTHCIVGELLGHGVKPQEVYAQIYDVVSSSDLQSFLVLANQMEFVHNGAIACLELSQNDLKKFSNGFDVRDKIFALFRSAKDVKAIVIFNEVEKTRTRVNFRSKGSVDVAKIAGLFHGGGHAKASGCTLDMNLKQTRQKILPLIVKEL